MNEDNNFLEDQKPERPPLTQEQERELARLFRDERIQKGAFAHALTLTKRNKQGAEDLVQEGWRKVVRGFAGFNKNGDFLSWFRAILTNAFIDNLRRRKSIESFGDGASEGADTETPDPETDAGSREWVQAIVDAINNLSPHHRDVARLRYIDDLEPKEIADRLGIPLNTVNTRLFHLRPMLRKKLLTDFPDIHEESTGYQFDRRPKRRRSSSEEDGS